MTLIDVTQYDLTTVDGQTQAVSDITDELNSQNDSLGTATVLNVANYVQLNVTVPGTIGMYSTTYAHGLGFAPLTLAWQLNNTALVIGQQQQYSMPYIEYSISGTGDISAITSFAVDKYNVTYTRQVVNPFEVGTFTAAFYIFNIPLGT